ncbi:methyltransferase domain-containing protein [Actinoallomurus sp. NPDC050550]|uniref:methyltransferase domain-containing protein n=1 Tax=Actinoallomurus sp. NPDC050550 TaxID=3154937 RepID=UPI0033F796F7
MTSAFETTTPDSVVYLDRLATTDLGRDYKGRMLALLDARPGQTVLDLGCGPGTDLGALAGGVGDEGRVIGVDRDPRMTARAHGRTASNARVRVVLGDAHALPLPDGGLDRARTDRVLQHVADPAAALAELRRVLRPGGRLVMGEPDWDTLAIDHPDVATARAYTRHVAERVVRNSVIGRQLARLAAEAGFAVPTVVPVTPVFRDLATADRILGIERNTRRAVEAGYLSADAAREWLDRLAAGPFLATATLHIVVADAPGPSTV